MSDIPARELSTYAIGNGFLELVPCGKSTENCRLWGEHYATNMLCYKKRANSRARQFCSNKEWKNCSGLAQGWLLPIDMRYDPTCSASVSKYRGEFSRETTKSTEFNPQIQRTVVYLYKNAEVGSFVTKAQTVVQQVQRDTWSIL